MTCSDKCPQEAMKAQGKRCQFLDKRQNETKCTLLETFEFVAKEDARQRAEEAERKWKEAEKKEGDNGK